MIWMHSLTCSFTCCITCSFTCLFTCSYACLITRFVTLSDTLSATLIFTLFRFSFILLIYHWTSLSICWFSCSKTCFSACSPHSLLLAISLAFISFFFSACFSFCQTPSHRMSAEWKIRYLNFLCVGLIFESISTVTDTEEYFQILGVQSIAQNMNFGQWGFNKSHGKGVVKRLYNICMKFLYLA